MRAFVIDCLRKDTKLFRQRKINWSVYMDNLTVETAMGGETVEYGARWKSGASSPELERVIRKDGVISLWKTQFKPCY